MPLAKPAPLVIMLTACEPSADRLGAALMEALKKARPEVQFVGVGGPQMQALGQVQLVPFGDLSVMGLVEVLTSIPKILRHLRTLAAYVKATPPALVVTIDAWDFSRRLAARVQKHAPQVPCVQYNPPKAWAWRPGRVIPLKKLFAHCLSVLPFEVDFFKRQGVAITYVGHPMVTALAPVVEGKVAQGHVLALLPGSRPGELMAHWPVFLETFRRLKKLLPQLQARLVLTVPEHEAVCQQLAPWQAAEGIEVVVGEARFGALRSCSAALAKSGTSNLELALLGVPAVVAYKMHPISYWLAKYLVKVPYISLPNLVLGRVVYPEFIQAAVKPENLARALYPWLGKPEGAARVQRDLAEVQALMATTAPPGEVAAAVILNLLPAAAK
jgi:lipid-A-disaccharide synthase